MADKKKIDEKNVERRYFPAMELRVASDDDADETTITGYAAVFNKRSQELWGFYEVIMPGAFTNSLKNKDDVRALIDHESGKILGRTKSGTLTLSEDEKGLLAEINPAKTTAANDVVESIRRGDIDGMSFAFYTVNDHWETVDKEDVRFIEEVQLVDVSVVTYPAYLDTSVALRSLEQFRSASTEKPEEKDTEKKEEQPLDKDSSGSDNIDMKQNRHKQLKSEIVI